MLAWDRVKAGMIRRGVLSSGIPILAGQGQDDRQQGPAAPGRQEPVVPDFDEASGKNMLQNAADEFFRAQREILPFPACSVLEPEGDLAVFQFLDAVVLDRDPVDVQGEVLARLLAAADGEEIGDPLLVVAPELRVQRIDQAERLQRRFEPELELRRQSLLRNEPVPVSLRQPLPAVRGQGASRNDVTPSSSPPPGYDGHLHVSSRSSRSSLVNIPLRYAYLALHCDLLDLTHR